MVTKVKLGNVPKQFKPIPVRVTLPDGEEGVILCTYKYRTKTEFGQYIDVITRAVAADAAREAEEATEAKPFSLEKLMEETRDTNAQNLLMCLDAWDLEVELNQENLKQLCDEMPGAALAMMTAYRLAATEGRLGN